MTRNHRAELVLLCKCKTYYHIDNTKGRHLRAGLLVGESVGSVAGVLVGAATGAFVLACGELVGFATTSNNPLSEMYF